MASAPRRLQARKQPRQARAAQTREWVLDAAAQVFAEHGYSAGTTNRIAERAGVSIGSLYQYFPNKDAILVELVRAHLRSGAAHLATHLAGGLPDELGAAVRLLVRATIDNHRESPALHRVLFEEAPRPPELLRALHETEDGIVAAVTALLAAHPQVRVPDPAVAARVVVVSVESGVHRLVAAPNPLDPRTVEDELVRMVVGYLAGGG